MSAPVIKEFRVDPARLASGHWCHRRERQIGEGDISASYSAEKIALEGTVRRPFTHQNALWVSVGGSSKGDYRAIKAYRLLPVYLFDGEPISYHENAMLDDEARQRPEGFYHGIAVKRRKKSFVLVGPSVVFLPLDDAQLPKQADFLDLLR